MATDSDREASEAVVEDNQASEVEFVEWRGLERLRRPLPQLMVPHSSEVLVDRVEQ